MAPRDLVKLGQLYLDSGRWKGRQIVPASWVKESTSRQVSTAGVGFTFSDSYGYQWWVTQEKGHHGYAAVGLGGQLVEVVPDLRLVVVTAAVLNDFTFNLSHLRAMIADAVIPAVAK
jgi:CubicO group peptidase (beta-lactamase class C family)